MADLCYISGKITGLSTNEVEKKFKDAEEEVRLKGYTPLSPLKLKHDHDRTWQSYMKEDLKALIECDSIYMLDNWKTSKGAKIELNLALAIDMQIIFQ